MLIVRAIGGYVTFRIGTKHDWPAPYHTNMNRKGLRQLTRRHYLKTLLRFRLSFLNTNLSLSEYGTSMRSVLVRAEK